MIMCLTNHSTQAKNHQVSGLEVNFFTHNLLDLKNAAKEFHYEAPVSDEDCVFLNSVYRSRYPSDAGLLPTGEPREDDAVKAFEIANTLLKWFNKK